MLDDVSVRYLVLVLWVVLSFVLLSIFFRVVVDLYYTCKNKALSMDTPTEKTCINCEWYHDPILRCDNGYTYKADFCLCKGSTLSDTKACEHWTKTNGELTIEGEVNEKDDTKRV